MSGVKYKIYGNDRCHYCVQAKRLLIEVNLPYEWVNIDIHPEERASLKAKGFKTIPQIWLGENLIGGYTDLVKFLHTGDS